MHRKGVRDMRFTSFFEMIGHFAEMTPNAPALLYGNEPPVSFLSLKKRVEERAAVLRESGRTCMGILSDGSLPCVIELFAAVHAGLQVVMLDENAPDELLQRLLPYADIDCLWGDEELTEELSPYLSTGVSDGTGRLLFFTSGTTDRSKAVVLTEKSLMASAWNGIALLPLSPDDRLLCMLPLAHVFGFVCGLLWALSCGASAALGRGPRHYADDCLFYKPTALSAVPMLWGFLLKQQALNPELKLVLIGAGDCPAPLLAAAGSLGIRLSFGYGLTETSSGVALSLGSDPYAMTVCPDDTITLADDGEILIDAPTCLMQGYYKQPDAASAVLDGGLLHTGDLGRFDENGLLHIIGRKKEMLVLSDGTKIFLPEYEAACASHLQMPDLAVCLDEAERVVLVLGSVPDDHPEEKDILRKLEPVLAERPRTQQIRRVVFRTEPLPRTATGKLRRWEIRI